MLKKLTFTGLGAIIILFLSLWYLNLTKEGFEIQFTNPTSHVISDLTINYPGGATIVSLPANSSINQHVKPEGDFGESEITMSYKDRNGETRKELIFGYIEMGYRGKAKVKILSVSEDGVIEFHVEAEIEI